MSPAQAPPERRVLRRQVSFWKLGQPEESRVAYTTDISATGCFIATNWPLPTKTEILVKIEISEEQCVVSGEVVRSVRVPLMLQRVKKSGMGVHFHNPEDEAVKLLTQMGVSASIKY